MVALESLFRFAEKDMTNYPPHNVVRIGENKYQITIAVAGFKKEDLEITRDGDYLIIEGNPSETKYEDEVVYITRNLSNRKFVKKFILNEHVKVVEVRHNNGLLTIDMKREIPDELKPHKIYIS